MNEGLVHGQVVDMLQDKNGVYWIATSFGLASYDGDNFKEITIRNGLKDDYIYDIFIDSKERFWVATEEGGVAFLEADTVFYPDYINVALGNKYIVNMAESADGTLWFATYEAGFYTLSPDSTITHYDTEKGLANNIVWHFFFDDDGTVWIATEGGISVFNGSAFKNYTTADGITSNYTFHIAKAENGEIWVSTLNGITRFVNGAIYKLTELSGKKLGSIYQIFFDGHVIYIGSEKDGVYVHGLSESHHLNTKNGLSSDYVTKIYKDLHGDIWIATDEDGINLIKDLSFISYGSESSLKSKSVISLAQRNDTTWVGTDNGLFYLGMRSFSRDAIPEKLKEKDDIWDILPLANGHILVLQGQLGLWEFSPKTKQIWDYRTKSNIGENIYVNDLFQDSKGRVWLAAQSGVFLIDGDETIIFTTSSGLAHNFVWEISEDSNGTIWLATEGGISIFENDQLVNITPGLNLPARGVYTIVNDSLGNYWTGTKFGVSKITKVNETYQSTPFPIEAPFLSYVNFLTFDSEKNLWVGTNGGLHRFLMADWDGVSHPKSQHFALNEFGKGVEFNHRAAILTKSRHLVFGSNKRGMVVLNPKTLKANFPAPLVYLKETRANLTNIYPLADNNDVVHLDHQENNLEFRFSAIGLNNQSVTFYRYKLEGFDDFWKEAYNINAVSYTNLPTGKYTFTISARTSKSDWSEPVSSSLLIIAPPFWETTPFYGLLFLMFVGLIGLITGVRLKFLEKNKLKKMVTEQTKSLQFALDEKEILIKEIHHRVKNNLAVISGLLELQMWNIENEEALKSLKDSQLRIKTMAAIHEKLYQNKNLARIEFKEYALDLINILQKAFKKPTVDITINLKMEPLPVGVIHAVPLGLILNELVSNSFEHAFNNASKGSITIELTQRKKECKLTLKDSGPGYPKNVLESGSKKTLGLTLVETLTEQMKGSFSLSNEGGATATIIFTALDTNGSTFLNQLKNGED